MTPYFSAFMVVKERSNVVPPFKSGQEVKDTYEDRLDLRGIQRRPGSVIRPGDIRDLYPRDGFSALAELERKVSALVGLESEFLVAYPAGMAALTAAVESANPTKGTTVLIGDEHYSEILNYADEFLRPRGVKVSNVDSGNPESVKRAIERLSPDIVLFETASNGTQMKVIDIEALHSALQNIKEKVPLLIIDNTITTPTVFPPSALFGDGSVRVAVAESGMKAYSLNQESFGIIYTNDHELWTQLFSRRITTGATPSVSAVKTILNVIPDTKEEFDARNRQIFRNTLALAEACLAASTENSGLTVSHPNLITHQNFKIAQSVDENGITLAFYISNGGDQFKLIDKLDAHPVIHKYADIGQSFGFDRTRIYPYYGYNVVRIAGGIETASEMNELSLALYDVLKR